MMRERERKGGRKRVRERERGREGRESIEKKERLLQVFPPSKNSGAVFQT